MGIIDRMIKNARASGGPFYITQPVEGLKKSKLVNGKWIPCTTSSSSSATSTTNTMIAAADPHNRPSMNANTARVSQKLTPALGRLSNAAEDALLHTARPGQESGGSNISEYHDATSGGNGEATADAVDKSTEQPFPVVDAAGSDDPHHSGHHRANKTTILEPRNTDGTDIDSIDSSNNNSHAAKASPQLVPLRFDVVPFPPFPISTPFHAPFFQPLSPQKNETNIIPTINNGTTTASSASSSPNRNIGNNITAALDVVTTTTARLATDSATTAGSTNRSNTKDDGNVAVSISTPSSISTTTTTTATSFPAAAVSGRLSNASSEDSFRTGRESMKSFKSSFQSPAAEFPAGSGDGNGDGATSNTIDRSSNGGAATRSARFRSPKFAGQSYARKKEEERKKKMQQLIKQGRLNEVFTKALGSTVVRRPRFKSGIPLHLLDVSIAQNIVLGLSSKGCTIQSAGATNDDDEKKAPLSDIQCNTSRNGKKAYDEENNVTKPPAKKTRKTTNTEDERVGLHDATNTKAITSSSSRSKHDDFSVTPNNDDENKTNNSPPSNYTIAKRDTGKKIVGDTNNGREQGKLDSQYKTNDTNEQHEKGTYKMYTCHPIECNEYYLLLCYLLIGFCYHICYCQ